MRFALALVLVSFAACDSSSSSSSSSSSPWSALRGGKVVTIEAPPSVDVAPWVRDQLAAARGRDVLVYVGAVWCEPCAELHRAVARGVLDARFPRLTLLDFDLDRDGDRLKAAGYDSEYVPLLMVPGSDGRGTGLYIEGSLKGVDAVAEITPRLAGLLERAHGVVHPPDQP